MTAPMYRNINFLLLAMMIITNYLMQHAGMLFFAASFLACFSAATMGAGIVFNQRAFTHAPAWFIPIQVCVFSAYLIIFAVSLTTRDTVLPDLPFIFKSIMLVAVFIPMAALTRHGSTRMASS